MNAPTRAEFLARRMSGIGGSDLAAVLGLSPYKTAFQLWQEKTGRFDAEPGPEQLERMHWGTVLEDVVARHYADATACKVQRINTQLQHPVWPELVGNVDRFVLAPGQRARWDADAAKVLGASRVLEVKTASAYALRSNGQTDTEGWGDSGTDQVPQHYWLQVQHYMGISGLHESDIAVLFGGQKFHVYHVAFDQPLMHDVFQQAADWWQRHVVADVPPPPTCEADAKRAWALHHPGKTAVVGADVAEKVARLRHIKAQMSALEAEEQAIRDCLTPLIADAEAITHMGQTLATWKANKPSQKTDWQAVAMASGAHPHCIAAHTVTKPGSRVLRLIEPKE